MKAGKVFVIEDDESIRLTLQYALEMDGYMVGVAEDGRKGLELLDENPGPCLVFLDLMMPVMDGEEFMAELRKSGRLDVSVVVLSAAHNAALPEGAVAMLKKPVDLATLLEVVTRYCVAPR